MRINKMTASFGALQNESLKLHEGLNIIEGRSEEEKASWRAFTEAMLYGMDRAQCPSSLMSPASAPPEGSMGLRVNGWDIELNRASRMKSAPMGDFSANYSGRGESVDELTGTNAGELINGVSADVFHRCAFIDGEELKADGRPFGDKLGSLISCGDSSVSLPDTEKRLEQWQLKRRNGKKGLLPELEDKLSAGEGMLGEMNGALEKLELMEAELLKARQECTELEGAVTESRKQQRKDSLSRLSSGKARLKDCSLKHDEAMDELSRRQEEFRSARFGDRRPEALEQEAAADMAVFGAQAPGPKSLIIMLPALICFVLAIVFAAVYANQGSVVLIIMAALLCLAAVVLFLRYSKLRQAAQKLQEQQRQILKKYKVTDPEQIYDVLDAHALRWQAVEEARNKEHLARQAYEDARAGQAELESTALDNLDFSGGSSVAAMLSRELSEARARAEKLSRDIASLKGRLSTMGDPLVISSELGCIRDRYSLIKDEYEAVSLASELIKEAAGELQSGLSLKTAKLAGEYISSVTGGKYDELLLSRDLALRSGGSGGGISGSVPDAILYLAVKLAAGALAKPQEGESFPLVADDSFWPEDELGYDNAMQLIRQAAKKRQVILFTSRAQSLI